MLTGRAAIAASSFAAALRLRLLLASCTVLPTLCNEKCLKMQRQPVGTCGRGGNFYDDILLPGWPAAIVAFWLCLCFCLCLCRLVIVARRWLPTDSQTEFPFRYVTARPTLKKKLKNNHTLHWERVREGEEGGNPSYRCRHPAQKSKQAKP